MKLKHYTTNTYKKAIDTPKLVSILKKVKNGPKPSIIYSNWLSSGIEPMEKLLDTHNIKYSSFTGQLSDTKKKKAVDQYNNGELDVLLLSSSGGEGLDLKNTRQIHIMEPHWNSAKIDQVVGRGIRYKSHESLPVSQRKVGVYYWISVPSIDKNKMGADDKAAVKGSIENENCVKVKLNTGVIGFNGIE